MSLPIRHSAKAVARYAPFFRAVTATYPRPIVVDPAPLTSETFAARFRDAVRGVVEFGTGPEHYHDVLPWSSDYIVASIPGTSHLVIGPAKAVKQMLTKQRAVGCVIDGAVAPLSPVHSPSETILRAILTLMDANLLEHAALTGVTEKEITPLLTGLSRPIEVLTDGGRITLL